MKSEHMDVDDLLSEVWEAHGGLGRWRSFATVGADLVTGGQLWDVKGVGQDDKRRYVQVALQAQWMSLAPFGDPSWRMVFTPSRVAIERQDGGVVAERLDPRSSFAGHELDTPWDPLHRAYFNGYALWTYLTTPFLLAGEGFESVQIAPWRDGDRLWRGVRVKFPSHIESHSPEQDFYFGEDFLLRRHDYRVDVAGGFPAAHYVSDYVEADGLLMPTKRRAYMRDERLQPIRERLMIAIDFDHVHFQSHMNR
jgi:hypothetical protein